MSCFPSWVSPCRCRLLALEMLANDKTSMRVDEANDVVESLPDNEKRKASAVWVYANEKEK